MRSIPLWTEGPLPASFVPLLRAMLHAARTSWSATFAAPVVLLGRCVFYMLLLMIITALWGKVVEEQVVGGMAHLLPAGGLGFYVGVTEIVTVGTPAAHLRLEDDIRTGLIESRLLRPKSHLLLRFAEAMGGAMARIIALTACGLALLAASEFAIPSPLWWPAIVLLLGLASIIGVLIALAVGLSVFWLGRALPLHIVNQKVSFLLGGLMAPVTLYPDWLASFAQATPYAASLYWPATFVTEPSAALFVTTLGWQALWIALLAALVAWLWTRGVARVLQDGV